MIITLNYFSIRFHGRWYKQILGIQKKIAESVKGHELIHHMQSGIKHKRDVCIPELTNIKPTDKNNPIKYVSNTNNIKR